VKLRYCDV